MISLLKIFRRELRLHQIRRKYPLAVIHDGAVVDDSSELRFYAVLFSGVRLCQSTIGAYRYIQENSICYNAEIGSFCSIAGDVVIGLADHPTKFISTSPVFYDNRQPLPRFFIDRPLQAAELPRTTIGADVWIGQRVMIKAGVTIGPGAVIGAGAVVTRDVAPYMIVAGLPARPLRRRFNEGLCQRLTESRWWTCSDEQLITLAQHFGDPVQFLSALEAVR